MAYKVIVKKRFTKKVVNLLNYIESEWGKTAADKFLQLLENRIDRLSHQPFTGLQSARKDVRSILIKKQNRLYYRVEGNRL